MPVPTGREVFTYDPVPLPETSGDPAAAKPLGVGPIANGGGVLDISVMAQFDGPVDVSVSVYAPAVDEMDVFFLDPQKKLKRLSKELFDSNMYGTSDREGSSHDDNEHRNADIRRLLYWKKGVTELNETLFTRPASELPSGIYSLILTVRNSDDHHSHSREYSFNSDDDRERRESEDGSYRWITHFVIP